MKKITSFVFLLSFFLFQEIFAQTTVTYTFTVAQSIDCGSSVPWTDPSKALVQDDDASVALELKSSNSPSACLVVSSPTPVGTDVTCNADVQGIQVTVRRQQRPSTGLNGNQEHTVQFYDIANTTALGTNQSAGAEWTNEWLDAPYGSTTDTWGLTLTYTDIVDPNMGINIRSQSGAVLGTFSTAAVDYVEMTVTYATCPCPPTPVPGVVSLQKL